MYKIEEVYFETVKELEEYLNKQDIIEHKSLQHIISNRAGWYKIVFYVGRDEKERKKYMLNYAKENLCKDCLTCGAFGYICTGSKQKCESWEHDPNAYHRIDRVI